MATKDLGELKVGMSFDTSSFENSVKNIDKQMRVVESSVRTATSGFEVFGKTSDSLKSKIDGLNQKIDLQKNKVKLLQEAFDESVKTKGLDSKATQDLQIKLNNANTTLNKMQLELKNTNKELKNKKNLLKDLGPGLENFSNKLSGIGNKLTLGVTAPLIAFGIQAIKTASDLQEVQNVVDTTFGPNATKINDWSKKAMESFGLTELEAKRMNGTMGAMLKSMGLTDKQTLDLSTSMVGLAGDFASFYNLDGQDAFDKIRSGISGETEPLKQLGINMSVANLEAFALSQGIKKPYAEMSQGEQTMLRYNYLLGVSKDAQGDFAKTSDSVANQLRLAKGRFTELSAEVGQKLLPYVNELLIKLSQLSDKFNNMSAGQKKAVETFALFAIVIGPLVKIFSFITGAISWLIIACSEGGLLYPAITAISGAFTALAGALGISVGWLGLIIVAIIGVIAAIVIFKDEIATFLVNTWNSITKFVSDVWNAIPKFFQDIGNTILNFLSTLPETLAYWFGFIIGRTIKFFIDTGIAIADFIKKVPGYIEQIGKFFAELPGKIWNALISALNKIGQFLVDIGTKIAQAMPGLIEKFITFWKELPDKLAEIGKNIVQGLFNGISGAWDWLKKKASGLLDSFVSGIKNGLGIHSPSKLFADEVGKWIPAGISVGIDSNADQVRDSLGNIKSMANEMNLKYEYGLGAIQGTKTGSDAINTSTNTNTTNNNSVTLVIENFHNDRGQSIENLMAEMEFYRKRKTLATGGVA